MNTIKTTLLALTTLFATQKLTASSDLRRTVSKRTIYPSSKMKAANHPTCEECGKTFTLKTNLKTHKLLHLQEKPHQCPHCPKTFTQSGNLNVHIKIHTGQRDFACEFCSLAFIRKNTLENHMRVHKDKKPFMCDHPGCTKIFRISTQLNSHKKTDHSEDPNYTPVQKKRPKQKRTLTKTKKMTQETTVYEDLDLELPDDEDFDTEVENNYLSLEEIELLVLGAKTDDLLIDDLLLKDLVSAAENSTHDTTTDLLSLK